MDETKEMFDALIAEVPTHGNNYPGDGIQITKDRERIFIWRLFDSRTRRHMGWRLRAIFRLKEGTMLTYQVKTNGDYTTVKGRSAKAVVEQMAKQQWTENGKLIDYMKEVSARVWAQMQIAVRVDSHLHFLADLVKAGVLKQEKNRPNDVK
jgi:hypothetical protein